MDMHLSNVARLGIEESRLQVLAHEFQILISQLGDVQAAVLATIDGFEIASHCPNPAFNADNLAAMASSLTSIARAVVREVSFSDAGRLMIESTNGKIFFQPVDTIVPCTLCVAVSSKLLLGKALWSIDNTVARLRDLVGAEI
jgi:predicted regulator of Ras-like GTPase activity (Roadblock/LC7/MglB family)